MDHVFKEYLEIKSQQFKLIAFYETAKFRDQAYLIKEKNLLLHTNIEEELG